MTAVQHDPFRSNEDAFLGPCARRSIVLVGHLPVMSGLWLSQFASRETRRVPTVCLLRLEHDAVQVELFRPGGQRAAVRASSSLVEALRSVAPLVDRWFVVPRSGDPVRLPPGTSDVVILTGGDEIATVAAYGLVKAVADAQPAAGSGRGPVPVAVEVLGATPDETGRVRAQLAKTAQAFLEIDLPVHGELQRVAPVESAFRGTFDAHGPTLEQLFALIAEAERAPAPCEPIASARPRALPEPEPFAVGDRFAPRRDRVPPRSRTRSTTTPEPSPSPSSAGIASQRIPPIDTAPPVADDAVVAPASAVRAPDLRPSSDTLRLVPPVSAGEAPFDARLALDRAAPTRLAPRRGPSPSSEAVPTEAASGAAPTSGEPASDRVPAARPPSGGGRIRDGLLGQDELAALLATLDEAPRAVDTDTDTGAAAEPAPVTARVPTSPAESDAAAARAALVPSPLPAPLAPHIGALEVLPFRAPRAPMVELAAGADGVLHLVAPLADLAHLVATRRWAREHAAILRAACPALQGELEPRLHAVVGSAVEAIDTDGVEIHALSLVEIGNARGWLAQPVAR